MAAILFGCRLYSASGILLPVNRQNVREVLDCASALALWLWPPQIRCSVAQVANLPYRRLLFGEVLERRTASGLATRDTVDTAVCATAEAQHDAVPEAGAPVRFMVPMRGK